MKYPAVLAFCIPAVVLFIAACSEPEPQPPAGDVLAEFLKEPLLNSLMYRGFELPRDAVEMKQMDVIVTGFNAIDGIRRVDSTGSFVVELTEDGGSIQRMIMGEGDLGSLMATQDFVRAGGNLLRAGQSLPYVFDAELIETADGNWRIIDGSTQLQ